MNGTLNYGEHFYQQVSADADTLEKNAANYPYSSLAGFLLLYHYKRTNHPDFDRLAKKTVLHFKSPLWLQFLLDQDHNGKNVDQNTGSAYVENKETEEELREEIKQPLYGQPSNGIEGVTELHSLPNENFAIPRETEKPESVAEVQMLPGGLQHKEDTADELGTSPFEPHTEGFQHNENAVAEPGISPAEEIAFEPLHTVDYFASQGIKITEEPVTNDKLGNQMKSFTAWLKSMKKLHPAKQEEEGDVVMEKLIQHAAEESNVNTEVLTEAMAEVLIKQDKKEKAIEMYHKLSLINPAKSVYFAAKIESIKSA